MTLTDELERLQRLHDAGTLSEAEFFQAKQRILQGQSAEPRSLGGGFGAAASPDGYINGMLPTTWLLLMHLSQLLAFAAGIGIAAPIVMWAMSKDQSREANQHGLMIINWFISSLIYGLVAGLLSLTVVGLLIAIPMGIALCAAMVIFPIIGAVKANRGEFWRYPLTIQLIDLPPAANSSY